MKNMLLVILFICSFVSSFEQKATTREPRRSSSSPVNIITRIILDPDNEKQTIHSFGASDCWTTKFIGKWQDTEKKNQIADLLFSLEKYPDGSPKGIGLSLWRFNIGAGSFEQGDSSGIKTDWRREECFLDEKGDYNWAKQAGQQWFLQAARKRGVPFTLGFSLSAPVFMTKNQRAYNPFGTPHMNIADGKWDDYARFLADVTTHFQFDFLSPINEPQWSWGRPEGASQEGTQVTNHEASKLVRLIAPHLKGQKADVVIGEAGQIDYLTGNNKDDRGDQIQEFFSPKSDNYIGDLPNVAPVISTHSYFSTCPDSIMINKRLKVAEKIKDLLQPIHVWQTEFGILGNICDQYNGSPRNTGIDYGLYVAKVIHHDLTFMNAASWQWWLAVSPYDYSDALVYINAPSGKINVNECKKDGIVVDSKQLWCLGNFSRFIRPGMKRIELSNESFGSNESSRSSLLASAYKDSHSGKLVVVIVNLENSETTLSLDVKKNIGKLKRRVEVYTTSASNNLKRSVASVEKIKIPAMSVVTVVSNYK